MSALGSAPKTPGEPPAWCAAAGRALAHAAGVIRVIGACTPLNLRAELARLEEAWRSGRAEAPRFVYAAAPDHRDRIRALEGIAGHLEREGDLGALHAARARELADEAAICEAAGTPALWAAARRRFARRGGEGADHLAAAWLAERPRERDEEEDEAPRGEPTHSDDERDPGSLLSRMRAAIAARRLPVRVVVAPELASLAATGHGVIQIAARRVLSAGDVARTVLHEVEGHVEPRVRAAGARLAIFAVGTARGSDDQEGRALSLERRAGLLGASRRRELALRHVAARSVEERADFVETARALLRACDPVGLADALRIAARAHRGGGLARERVYLPAFLRYEEAAARDPRVERTMSRGSIAVDATGALHPFTG